MQVQLRDQAAISRKVIPIMPITPYTVKGRYRNIKTTILSVALFVYFALPWLRWNGHARTGQPILLDIANSRFHLLDVTIYPQDLMLLLGLMIFAAAFLFVAATIYGRVFCGFFCFQTIWTDAFRFIETFVQGEAQARNRLRQKPWGFEKAWKLGLTHGLWLLLALATAFTFTLYFADARQLCSQIIAGHAPWAAYVTIAVLTSTTYVAAGIAREEICRVACPYGKFQSVMQDSNTTTVLYDQARGERSLGRARTDKSVKAAARADQGIGDCIDCGYCVNVCPTGVDIRQGFQIDCISCGLCIDACNTVMEKMHLATGLIRFDKTSSLHIESGKPQSTTIIRKWGYLTVLLLCLGFMAYKLQHIDPFSASVQQQAQPLSTVLSNGDIKTRYILRITNKEQQPQQYRVEVNDLPIKSHRSAMYVVPAGKTHTFSLDIVMEADIGRANQHFAIAVEPLSHSEARQVFDLNYIAR